MDNNKIGKFIATLRKEKNLTQQELGNKLFVTDKAVSKWERGLSLPDISLLNNLAKVLDVEVIDILDGKKGTTRKINVEEEMKKIEAKFKKQNQKRIKKIILCITILIFIIICLIFKNTYLGYEIKDVNYSHSDRTINIGIPKVSFMIKNNDRSYSFKNLRNSNIVENEVKKYLNTLKYSTCNDTIYYYNENDNFSIINYTIKNHILYSTVSYEIVDKDYCFTQKMSDYSKKLNGILRFHALNGEGFSLSEDRKFNPRLVVLLLDSVDSDTQEFKASLEITYLTPIPNNWKMVAKKEIEKSTGNYEIKEDKLYYYRTNILEKADDISIPEVSVFKIEDGNLILIDNYLSKYEKNIVLK